MVTLGLSSIAYLLLLHRTSGLGDYTYIGPLRCTDPTCPTANETSRPVNNSNFHLRDVSMGLAADGYYYLTGTSTSAGDNFWTDVWGVIRLWWSKTLEPGSFEGGRVVFNLTRDCKFCGSGVGTCRDPSPPGNSRVWAPEFHYLLDKAADVEGSGGYFLTFHFHCAGGGSGVLRSTSGLAVGPYTDLVSGVPGGDVSLFQDPADGDVYTISSGGAIIASLLSKDMSHIISSHTLSPECGNDDCSSTAIGFEGPFVVAMNGSYFLSSSAFGTATAHGGPKSVYNSPNASKASHYSAFMGVARSFLGPYTNGKGQPGSWLAVDSGGHNAYFWSKSGKQLYSTVWYGSDPNKDTPSEDAALVDLPNIVSMQLVNGRLVTAADAINLSSSQEAIWFV